MAAKSKRTTTTGIHGRALQHRADLLEEARGLRREGRIGAAKGVESRAQQVDQLIGALEGEAGPTKPANAH